MSSERTDKAGKKVEPCGNFPQDTERGGNEEKSDDEDVLAREMESWKGFEYALREPNATLFNKMLKECLEEAEYSKACNTKGSCQSAESLFMVLIFQQQKMISELIEKMKSYQNSKKS